MLFHKELLPYDHIIFDWNGTLLSDVEFVHGILIETLSQHNLKAPSLSEFRDQFTFPLRHFYSGLGLKDEAFDSVQEFYIASYQSRYKNTSLYPGTLELMDQLKASGKKLSILSAAEEGHLLEAVDHFGVLPHVHHVFGVSNHLAEGKVKRGYDLVEKVSIPREKTVIVGDTLYDAEVGKALNINVLLVADGHQSYKRLSSESDCKVLPSRYLL